MCLQAQTLLCVCKHRCCCVYECSVPQISALFHFATTLIPPTSSSRSRQTEQSLCSRYSGVVQTMSPRVSNSTPELALLLTRRSSTPGTSSQNAWYPPSNHCTSLHQLCLLSLSRVSSLAHRRSSTPRTSSQNAWCPLPNHRTGFVCSRRHVLCLLSLSLLIADQVLPG